MNASAPTDGQHQNGEEDSGNYRQHHHHKHHPKHVSLEKVKASKEKEADPLATAREVFYFIPSIKVKIMIALGIICACVSGAVFPALAFFFSTSFEDLSAATGTKEAIWM